MTGYKRIAREAEEGRRRLADHSRAPHHGPSTRFNGVAVGHKRRYAEDLPSPKTTARGRVEGETPNFGKLQRDRINSGTVGG